MSSSICFVLVDDYLSYYNYRQIGIDPPRGVLLYGPPGVFKIFERRKMAKAKTLLQ